MTIKVKKRVHTIWNELKKSKSHFKIVGKYQYTYSSEKGEISLIFLPDYFMDGEDFWEIYCIKGNLFEDVERFDSKKDAEKRIKELL